MRLIKNAVQYLSQKKNKLIQAQRVTRTVKLRDYLNIFLRMFDTSVMINARLFYHDRKENSLK